MSLTYASLCDGIGAVRCAWQPLGWRCAWTSEIEPFPVAVVEHHWKLPNLGDMTKIDGKEAVNKYGPIDLVVGGTPCQSFSVAGLRKGMADPRGNLALVFLRLVDSIRPRWVVWENVPGVLSSGKGRDFGSFIGGLAELGYGCFGRILDAQYFGVPQRRRRVFVVGYLGDWRRAAAVLLERQSLSGNPAPRREKGKGVAGTVAAGAHPSGFNGRGAETGNLVAFGGNNTTGPLDVATACLAKGGTGRGDFESETFVTAPTLRACGVGSERVGDTRGQDCLVACTVPASNGGASSGMHPITVHQLQARHDSSEDGTGRGVPLVVEEDNQNGVRLSKQAGSVRSNAPGTKPGGSLIFQSSQSGVREVDAHATLDSHNGSRRHNGIVEGMSVRRLTPRECERLQGFTTSIDRAIIEVCLDHQNGVARVGLKCLRSPSGALPADAEGNIEPAPYADATLWNDRESLGTLVAVHVRISCEPRPVRVLSHGKLLWSANGAEVGNLFRLRTELANTAHGIAAAALDAAQAIATGGAGSPRNTLSFTLRVNGKWPAVTFGPENTDTANVAGNTPIGGTKSTMSSRGQGTSGSLLTGETWLCSVLNVMISFIPKGTPARTSFGLCLDVESDYTLIDFKGKPAADGPRYRAIGNSMAVPVMAWIGERIEAAEDVTQQGSTP